MANTQKVKSRFQQKWGTTGHWSKATEFYPLKGEICIYQDFDENGVPLAPRYKIGIWDGESETTDNMLLGNLPFASAEQLLELGLGENSIQQVRTNAQAITERSVAIGENSKAGCRGYYIVAINFDNNTIFLTDEFPSITYCQKDGITTKYNYSEEEPGYTEEIIELQGPNLDAQILDIDLGVHFIRENIGYDINNDITLIIYGYRVAAADVVSYHYYSAAKITNIDEFGTVTLTLNLDEWPFTSIIPVSEEYPWYPSIISYAQPEIGAVEIKQGALSLGGGLAVSESSIAVGKDTQAIGDYSLVGGKGAKSGYASVSIGANTSAMGVAATAFGDRSNASGSYSVAAGYDNDASGTASVALGSQTEATAQAAFAEGFDTHATNTAAHTEGRGTRASGEYSHAENLNTIAEGNYSHAEGNGSHAKANGSHAEGVATHADTYCSHTEGQGTIASAQWQHVQGKFNKPDSGMAHIIGWGESKENPKNIHTVDRSGNAWYAGDVTADKISLKGTNVIAENAIKVARTAETVANTANSNANAANIKINNLNIKNADTDNIRQINAEIASGINNAAAFGTSHILGGNYSFAEGFQTTNLGSHAHIEGSSNNTAQQAASNYNSNYSARSITVDNAEQIWGLKQFALSNGKGAHVEGWNNVAIGDATHAEGYGTMALANYAHASGEGTRATVQAQTVVGKYNEKDADALFIVGNGEGFNNSQRSNAFIVKKDGTGYLGDKKILVEGNCYKKEEIDAKLGEIDSALDAIIAIQESLIGGNV